MQRNPVLDTDSYKSSHFRQLPPGTESMFSYMESRGGQFGRTVFFGLQYILEEYFSKPITAEQVKEAGELIEAHGEPFPWEGWNYIVEQLGGKLPLRVRAVAEGTVVPTHNALLTVESTDPKVPWVVGWFETQLMRLWYPITVATQSFAIKRLIWNHLVDTADDPQGEISFKLHDFGSRGVSSAESAGIGGLAHLVNFMGTDTLEALRYARNYYGEAVAGFSIPAAEHSTITSWGKSGEERAYSNMVSQFGGPGKLVAVVSDSYDLWKAIENYWCGTLLEQVKASGATVVIRPDSGDPVEVVLRVMQELDKRVECRRNTKGFKVLPSYFRVIQGDGVNFESIGNILTTLKSNGYSASNIAFGMGGALLQKVDRDTQKFAYKCSQVVINGLGVDVFKDPVTDPGKKSKRGKLDLVFRDGKYQTVQGEQNDSVLQTVFINGEIRNKTTLAEIRKRAQAAI